MIKRSTLRLPQRPQRDRTGEFASFKPQPRSPARMATVQDVYLPTSAPSLKTPDGKNQAIRDSARDEACQVRIPGACNFDRATTVWSHVPLLAGGRGMGLKAIDECGAYCCSACHDVVDGRRPLPSGASPTSVLLDWMTGHLRSLVRLKQKGIL